MDNSFGYSNSGLNQSLNGITSITDGSGASITDGNAIFIDTNTNTATINNNLTIPLSSLITLYGNIFLPAYNITLTPSIMSGIGNLSGLTTRVSNVETKTTGISYDTPSSTTTILGNSIFGSSGALATYSTMRINSDINLYGNINLPTFSTVISPSILNNIKIISDKFTYTGASNNYLDLQNTNLGLYRDLYLSPSTNILQGNLASGFTYVSSANIKNLPFLDATSSIQTQINNIKTILTGATYDTTYSFLNLANNLHIYGYLNLDNGITLQTPYINISNQVLSYLNGTTSPIQTQFNNIASTYAKLSNSNTFTNNTTIFKNIYVDDAAFNNNNYMQLNLSAGGSYNGHNSVVGIDFTTWTARNGASARIYGLDNSNYSAHLVFATASPGSAQYTSSERMRIQDDGNIGIGTQTPAYLLDINGTLNGNTIYENGTLISSKYATQTALNSYVPSQSTVSANATTGTFYLVFTNNNSGGASNLSIGQPTYDATNKILKVNNIDAGASTNSTIYNSTTTGTITIGGALTTGNIKLGLSTQTGTNQINGPTTFTGNTTFNNTITGNISGSSGSCTGNATTATTATNVSTTADNTSTSLFIPLITGSGTSSIKVNQGLSFNATTNELTSNIFIGSLTGNATTATRATNVSITTDNTSTALYIPLTTASTTNTSVGLKVDNGLSYNAATNTLTTTTFNGAFTGNITGSLDGASGSSYTIYNTITTGTINFLASITTGILNIGKSGATGAINLLNNVINIGTSTSTTTINGSLVSNNNNIMPAGSILTLAYTPGTTPTGYLKCDGTSYLRASYPNLFAAIGVIYGSTGSTAFSVPNYSGGFLRCTGSSAVQSDGFTYSGPTIGITPQLCQMGSHNHTTGTTFCSITSASMYVVSSLNTQATATTETRPYNFGVQYYIKY